MRTSQRGFTLIETLVASAIATLLIAGLVLTVSRLVSSASSLNTRLVAETAADHALERMTSDAASSWASYVPANDAYGRDNADGHEVAFFSEDAAHRPLSWAYDYDASTRHLLRLTFSPGAVPNRDEDLGAFDAFAATPIDASTLGASDPLFAMSSIPDVVYGFDASATARGGNGLVRVELVAAGARESVFLASGTSPTTFTVVVTYTPSPTPIVTSTPAGMVLQPGATATPFPAPT